MCGTLSQALEGQNPIQIGVAPHELCCVSNFSFFCICRLRVCPLVEETDPALALKATLGMA